MYTPSIYDWINYCSVSKNLLKFIGLLYIFIGTHSFAQSTISRTVNLESAKPIDKGELFFNFTHRFNVVFGHVINYPTFILAYGPIQNIEIKSRYATNSEITIDHNTNEIELLAKYYLFELKSIDLSVAIVPAYNFTANSFDGVIPIVVDIHDKLISILNISLLGKSAKTQKTEVIIGTGLIYFVQDNISLTVDINNLTDKIVFGSGISFVIPNSPHTISLQITNATTGTIQGYTFRSDNIRYGFEFTTVF